MATRVISRKKRDTLGDAMGALGQGLSGFAGGYMGKKQMDMAEKNSESMQDLLKRAFGVNGQNINPNAAMSAPAGSVPMPGGAMLPGLDMNSLLQNIRLTQGRGY